MEDDHVDRLGVEVRQRMKLTSTNRSIGLIVPIACVHHQGECNAFVRMNDVFKTNEVKTSTSFSFRFARKANLALCRPGGSGGVAAPVPIPNTAVKRPSADGTSS